MLPSNVPAGFQPVQDYHDSGRPWSQEQRRIVAEAATQRIPLKSLREKVIANLMAEPDATFWPHAVPLIQSWGDDDGLPAKWAPYIGFAAKAFMAWAVGGAVSSGFSSGAAASEGSAVAAESATAAESTAAATESWTQVQNYFQEGQNSMDIFGAGEFGSENLLPTDIHAFNPSVISPETFVDNWDMLPDPTIVYQAPEVLSNPMPGFMDRLGDALINKGTNALLNTIFDRNEGPLTMARAPANPIANPSVSRAGAATMRGGAADYYNAFTSGSGNVFVVLGIGFVLVLFALVLGRK